MTNVKLVAMVGSLRKGSVNAQAAQVAVEAEVEGVSISQFDLSDVPLYNGDIEAAGLPAPVQALIDTVAEADGLLIFSPEYNGSFPAVTKNAIDWMSRPPRAWTDTAVSLVVASPGPRAGLGIRTHFEAIMEFQPIRLFGSLGIGEYGDKTDDTGAFVDPETRGAITDHVAAFAAFAAFACEG